MRDPSPAEPDEVKVASWVKVGAPAPKSGRQLSKRKNVMSWPALVSANQTRKNSRLAPSGMVSNWASAKFSVAGFVLKMSSPPETVS